MTVYVDDMFQAPLGQYGRMKMSHLIADTHEELMAMVDRIGVNAKWLQHPGRHDEHFDIALSKRAFALAHGAVAVTMKQCACMVRRRYHTGSLGSPDEAVQWRQEYYENRRNQEQVAGGQ